MSGESGEDSVGGHGSVFVENDGRGVILRGSVGKGGPGARGGDGVVEAVVGHVGTRVAEV